MSNLTKTKKLLFLPACVGLFAFAGSKTHVHRVLNGAEKTAMAYALDSNGNTLDSAKLDASGNYQFTHLKPGLFQVVIKSEGQEDIEIQNVEHLGNSYSYHISSSNSTANPTNPMVTYDYGVTSDEMMEPMSSRSVEGGRMSSPASMSGSISETESRGISVRGTITRKGSTKEMVTMPASTDLSTGSGSGSSGTSGIKPGQITAGNWRDLDNWTKWEETNKSAAIFALQNSWGFHTQNRFATQFLDKNGKPVIGAKVILTDNFKSTQWEAITDNNGKAELWAELHADVTTTVEKSYKINIIVGERSFDFGVKRFAGSADVFTLPISTSPTAIADVAFVVDATGSMGDEISYLQAELLDVATRVKKQNRCLNLRLGSVFYRDHGDNYVTVTSDFSSDVKQVANFIYDQSAGGGGDFPEAVDDAMEAAIEGMNWSENAISKIMFLVLDAPPHETPEIKERMQRYTKLAASKGIKIIPITASGINQSTEFLMKYLAMATNGNYIYITDHSGIGNAHEKPTGVKENVQYLNDLMVDIINANTQWDGCKDSTNNQENPQPGTVEIITNGQWQVQFYPNPAIDKITIRSNEILDEITLYDIRGTELKKITQITNEKTTIDIPEIPTGVYIVRCRKGEKLVSCRILVMK